MEDARKLFFESILETRSMTNIQYMLENEIPHVQNDIDRDLMRRMQESNSLDEIWIMCHEWIGYWHLSAAKEIKAFLDKKRGTK